ncbi:MAG: lytic murein transglycosylase B [Cellvibrionales bacterium TMED148]|nr:lytic murein transglycosylase B [Porticoccaceae bacterium]RPG93885.1 MAG: lytic murein transglycosylase B [Cellvibrionales bacterium TMED148]
MKNFIRWLFIPFWVSSSLARGDYSEHPDALKFIDSMVQAHQFSRIQLTRWLSNTKKIDSIVSAMSRPAEKVKPWHEYRRHFISNQRISWGVDFWDEHDDVLQRAQESLGVDSAIVVSIIGVETNYGRNVGNHRVIDALSTLAFDFYTQIEPREKRRLFFTGELENLMLIARAQNMDPMSLIGSYAGAMGWGQFMPSSYRNYAVDFDQDGFTDIWNNPTDIIGSVANYLAKHGWASKQPIAVRALLQGPRGNEISSAAKELYTVEEGDTLYSIARRFGTEHTNLQEVNFLKNANELSVGQVLSISSDLKMNQLMRPSKTIYELKDAGLTPVESTINNFKALPIKLDAGDKNEYWMGFTNFYVISRYNPRIKYAMAVYQLSELIKSEYCEIKSNC